MAKISKEEAVQWYAQNRGLYKRFSQKIHNILSELLEGSEVTVHAITNRAKEVDSFKKKIDNPKYDDPLNQITDLSGIRVIAYVEDDLKPICKIIEETFDIDVINSTDKSHDLGIDKVGYKSIHYIAKLKDDRSQLPEYRKFKDLKFELQIRTILQHAWAEIEHDRNYKFNGVLPPEIKRRFRILAGTLELIDREFNQLSNDIDEISKNVDTALKTGHNLNDIEINSTTIKEYLKNKFRQLTDENILQVEKIGEESTIINELKLMGFNSLQDLDNVVTKDFVKKVTKSVKENSRKNIASITILRLLLMVNDVDLYFQTVWQKDWENLTPFGLSLLNEFKIDINPYVEKYHLKKVN